MKSMIIFRGWKFWNVIVFFQGKIQLCYIRLLKSCFCYWQLASAQHVFQVLSNFSWIFTGVEGDGRDVGEVEDGAVEVTEDVEEETVEDVEGKEVEGECIYTAMSMENFMYGVGMRQHTQLQDVAGPYNEILTQ